MKVTNLGRKNTYLELKKANQIGMEGDRKKEKKKPTLEVLNFGGNRDKMNEAGPSICLTPEADLIISISSFLSLVTGCCYRLLENPTISHQKNRPTREAITQLLGVALTRYNHMLGKFSSILP